MSRKTVARIDLGALRHNLGVVQGFARQSQVVSVIKADAYGHGIQRVARALDETDLFAVATLQEADSVRNTGWPGRLLLLQGCADRDDFKQASRLELEMVVHHQSQLDYLAKNGCRGRQRLWIKLDTGMHRLGFPPAQLAVVMVQVDSIPGCRSPVLMTHFACADEPGTGKTQSQIRLFDSTVDGYECEQSMASSAAILGFESSLRDYVRPGIMLYGISPIAGMTGLDHGLRPVMTLGCELIAVNRCRKGDRVGYGASYECPEDMRIGVAAIGYGDGYPRHLRNGTPLLVNGRRASLAGRVSMDLITIDLRDHDDARAGDEVTLWGDGLPVEEVAAWGEAIAYELVCGVTGRVERVEI